MYTKTFQKIKIKIEKDQSTQLKVSLHASSALLASGSHVIVHSSQTGPSFNSCVNSPIFPDEHC